jgi:phage shock protein PspC (stress-responsive transcriptional regulator)
MKMVLIMKRDKSKSIVGGVLAGISVESGISLSLLRVLFLIGFFAVGGITFGISSFSMSVIYILFWIFTPSH